MAGNKNEVTLANKELYSIIYELSYESYSRDWINKDVRELSLDEISMLKTIEDFLPKNVFLTIDYLGNFRKREDGEIDTLNESEISDYIREEEAVIVENGASQHQYETLFGKCFIKDDGSEAIRVIGDCKKKDDEGIIDGFRNSEDPLPFLFEMIEGVSDDDDDERNAGWNFREPFAYNELFGEDSGIPGLDVNVPVDYEQYFRLDAEGQLWSNVDEDLDWHKWIQITASQYDECRTEAEHNLSEYLKKKQKRKRRRKKDTETK